MTAADARRGNESELAKKRRARVIDRLLAAAHPDAHCELDYGNPLELAIATILSAQCTDARVNMVTPALFRKYRTAADYARARPGELERDIRSTGFFNSKARSLRRAGAAIAAEHGGRVPDTMEELVRLPGVGRKTADFRPDPGSRRTTPAPRGTAFPWPHSAGDCGAFGAGGARLHRSRSRPGLMRCGRYRRLQALSRAPARTDGRERNHTQEVSS